MGTGAEDMSTTQQPEALRDARWYMVNRDGMATLCTDRADAEKEAEDAQSVWPHMGPHRAVQLVEAADVEALRTGYAAARLEIESLRARSVAPRPLTAEERAVLDAAVLDGVEIVHGGRVEPAGAQQPGDCGNTPYDEGPFTLTQQTGDERAAFEQWSKVTNQGYDLARNVSGKPQTFESTETEHAWRGFFHGLRASHGQAPAQAIPAAAAGCTRSHPHENMDSACRAKAAIAEMQNMAARGAEATTHDLERFVAMLAAAPTTQPAPQQGPAEALARAEYYIDNPSAWSSFDQGISDDISAVTKALRAALPAPQQEAQEPDFWTVCAQYEGGGETGWIPLPGYSNETEHGVKNLVLQAARKEGYKGTVTGRLMELNWEILPVYLAPWAAPQPLPASQGDALPTIKGASITGGYVVVTPAGWADDKATVLRDAILRTFPVNPAFTPKHDDAARAAQEGK